MKKIIIIGAGISGTLIAHELSRYQLDVTVLEASNDVANGATGANSAIIHSGHDPLPGTLKAKYNVLGNRMFKDFCAQLQVAYRQVGAFVAATSQEEEKTLETLIRQCEEREIPYEILTGDEARKEEPHLSNQITKVLSLPTTGIVTPWEVAIAAMEEAMLNGAALKLNEPVRSITNHNGLFTVTTSENSYEADEVINCAGCKADEISAMLGIHAYTITPRKGEYFILDHQPDPIVHRVIYPVPGPAGKGVLAVPTIHNNILLGPDSAFVDDKDRVDTGSGLDFVKQQLSKTIKDIPWPLQIHTYAGLRPTGDLHDFYIQEDEQIKGFIHVACIESPGLASSCAIAKDVAENLVAGPLNAELKETYIHRRKHIVMAELSDEEKDAMIKADSDYGKMICRCERISLGEIKDVIHRECGALSVKGVKRRCRPGMGRCQGGFCEPEVVKILKKELNLKDTEVMQSGKGSEILVSEAKKVSV